MTNRNRNALTAIGQKARSGFLDGWYFGDEESKNRVLHLQFNYTNNIMANLVGGNFYTGLMLLLARTTASSG